MDARERIILVVAGALGAAVWAAQQPLDRHLFRSGYDDVELLGRAVRPRRTGWRAIGWAMHVMNGAMFGLAYSELLRRTPGRSPRVTAHAMAQVENFGLYPLAALIDRVHPARDDIAPSFGGRQLAQATWRHALLGAVLGEVAVRLRRRSGRVSAVCATSRRAGRARAASR